MIFLISCCNRSIVNAGLGVIVLFVQRSCHCVNASHTYKSIGVTACSWVSLISLTTLGICSALLTDVGVAVDFSHELSLASLC